LGDAAEAISGRRLGLAGRSWRVERPVALGVKGRFIFDMDGKEPALRCDGALDLGEGEDDGILDAGIGELVFCIFFGLRNGEVEIAGNGDGDFSFG